MRSKYKNALEHFNSLVVKHQSGCWELKTATDSNGYGRFTHSNMVYRAHVFAYTNLVGPLPNGKIPHHICKNKRCCNPTHLEPKTIQENLLLETHTKAGINVRKTHCPRGHEYTLENTLYYSNGRQCKSCKGFRGVRKSRGRSSYASKTTTN